MGAVNSSTLQGATDLAVADVTAPWERWLTTLDLVPINRIHDDLPRARQQESSGQAPDPTPRFGPILVERWVAAEAARASTRLARFRHSDAGGCARALSYAALDVPESNPMDKAGIYVAQQGTTIHEEFQRALADHYHAAAEFEVKVVAEDADGRRQRGGHSDVVLTTTNFDAAPEPGPWVTTIEAKTVGGYGFKAAVGCPPASRIPEGPKHEHVVQLALNAKGNDADEAVLLYLSREAISIGIARDKGFDEMGRIMAEWTFDRATYTEIADQEIARVEGILRLVDEGQLARRRFPDPRLPQRHEILDPRTGGWVEYSTADDETGEGMIVKTGTWWACAYCRYQDTCIQTPPGRIPVDTLVQLGVLEAKEASTE